MGYTLLLFTFLYPVFDCLAMVFQRLEEAKLAKYTSST
jgi:hypothetical protein